MSVYCNNCGRENASSSKFCQYCGTRLEQLAPTMVAPAEPGPAGVFPPPSADPPTSWRGSQVDSYGSGQQSRQIGQMGNEGQAALNIWGPFAGYGTRGHHFSWLLDDLADKAEVLHQTIGERFQQRAIPQAAAGWRELVSKGLLVERRRFYLIRRDITTVALYIAKFGQDLFISMVTYAKGPLSNFRMLLVGLIFLFQLFYMFGYTPVLANAMSGFNPLFGGGPSIISLAFLMCVIGPAGFFNTILIGLILLYSFYKWLTEKDFLAILRTPPNEFQIDDTVALEKSVEETVRQALDAVGIDPKLMPARPEQTYRRRLV